MVAQAEANLGSFYTALRGVESLPDSAPVDLPAEPFYQALEDDLEKVNRAFLERCNEVETTLEMASLTNRIEASDRPVASASASVAIEEPNAEARAARNREQKLERERQEREGAEEVVTAADEKAREATPRQAAAPVVQVL